MSSDIQQEEATGKKSSSAVRIVLLARKARRAGASPAKSTTKNDFSKAKATGIGVPLPSPKRPTETVQTRPRSNAIVELEISQIPPIELEGAGGKSLKVRIGPKGDVVLTSPPPPIRSVTFSGGGGKGAALPGAITALEESGLLKHLTEVSGASVGSMTAALVACGSSAEEFAEIANDPALVGKIKEGKNMAQVIFGGGLSGAGLEEVVRTRASGCVKKRIAEYIEQKTAGNELIAPEVLEINKVLLEGKKGPTFGQLRTLSKIIPGVKEVKISGTYVAELDPQTGKPLKDQVQQLVMFTADTEPDLEVAVAVRASAALPPVFDPVDIKLSSGILARFQDGGVLNNAPAESTLLQQRNLDPIPPTGGMTFIFEEDAAKEAKAGVAVPRRSRLGDWLTKTEHSAAEYSKNRRLADKPEEIVIVPLSFEVKKGRRTKKKDFSGLLSGTINFGMALEDKLKLQELTEEATSAHISKRLEDKSYSFESMEQMLMCIPLNDLEAIAGDLDGATEALAFRVEVISEVQEILRHVKDVGASAAASDESVMARFESMDKQATDQPARQLFIARTVNQYAGLDDLLAALKSGASPRSATLDACVAVNGGIIARAHANTILRELIYPKMVRVNPKGIEGEILSIVDSVLRAAQSPEDVNEGLTIAVAYYKRVRSILKRKAAVEFAAKLENRLMKID